jgi:hypothetical protein
LQHALESDVVEAIGADRLGKTAGSVVDEAHVAGDSFWRAMTRV